MYVYSYESKSLNVVFNTRFRMQFRMLYLSFISIIFILIQRIFSGKWILYPKKIIHYIYCMKVPVRISIIDKFLILQFESSYKIIDRICIYMYAHKEYNSLWSLDLINLI